MPNRLYSHHPRKKAMHRCLLSLFLIIAPLLSLPQKVAATAPTRPFPQHVTYAPGTISPNHVSQNQLDDDTRAMYDLWKLRYLIPAGQEADGHPRFRVEHGGGNTVSESQGYGLILAVMMAGYDPDARLVFDGLWEFALDHPSIYDSRLMDWFVNGDESPDNVGDDSAFDGDCDMAYALLLAEQQWGNDGRFHYRQEAQRVLAGILDSTIGPESKLPMLGDWINDEDPAYNQWTPRTSDFITDHFRVFQQVTGNDAWSDVRIACLNVVGQMQHDFSPTAGLLPDFLVPVQEGSLPLQPAPPNYLEGPNDGRYDYNACRDPWRLGTHALVTGNPQALAQVRLMAQWIRSATAGNPLAIRAGYNLDGNPTADYFTTAFASPLAVACMCDSSLQSFLNDLYDAIHISNEDYYEDTLTTLCLLVLSNNWWTPALPLSHTPAPQGLKIHLSAPTPNPFNPATTLTFAMDREAFVELAIYDLKGRQIRQLVSCQMAPGQHTTHWDGRSDSGSVVPAGMYFGALRVEGEVRTIKATLVK